MSLSSSPLLSSFLPISFPRSLPSHPLSIPLLLLCFTCQFAPLVSCSLLASPSHFFPCPSLRAFDCLPPPSPLSPLSFVLSPSFPHHPAHMLLLFSFLPAQLLCPFPPRHLWKPICFPAFHHSLSQSLSSPVHLCVICCSGELEPVLHNLIRVHTDTLASLLMHDCRLFWHAAMQTCIRSLRELSWLDRRLRVGGGCRVW